MSDKSYQSYGYSGSRGYGRPGCSYNCYCDNCCKKMQDQRENDPRWRAGEKNRQEQYRIATRRK